MGKDVPTEITLEDKTANEQVRLIAELDEKDKSIIFGMIETMLTKKKFKDFFQKNVAICPVLNNRYRLLDKNN